MNRSQRIFAALILLLAGAGLLIGGVKNLRVIGNYKSVSAVVVRVDSEGEPGAAGEITLSLKYTVDGAPYGATIKNSALRLREGDTVALLYDPRDPAKISLADRKHAVLRLSLGCLFTFGGIAFPALTAVRSRKAPAPA